MTALGYADPTPVDGAQDLQRPARRVCWTGRPRDIKVGPESGSLPVKAYREGVGELRSRGDHDRLDATTDRAQVV